MRCAGWELVTPKDGSVKCSFDEIDADVGGTCKITCEPNYSTDTDSVRCLSEVGWFPTRNPVCTSDGSLTMIIVPSVVGSIFVLFLVGFIYARFSNRCQSKTRAHDETVEEGNLGEITRAPGQKYMLKTNKRPGAVEASEERNAKRLNKEEKQQRERATREKPKSQLSKRLQNLYKKRSRRKRSSKKVKLSLKQRITARFYNKTTASKRLFRKRLRNVKSPWKKNGPKRVVGKPNGIGASSMCGDIHYISGSQSSFPDTSSCSSASDSPCCLSSCDEIEQETVEKVEKPSSLVQTKKVPPPRPPVPKVISKKILQQKEDEVIARVGAEVVQMSKNGSSGYSSDETQKQQKRLKNSRKSSSNRRSSQIVQKKRSKKKVKVKKRNDHNPYDHYPVAGADRKYQDFEHDYRKNEHIFEGGRYHPHYHPVKTYPMKPAHKIKKEKHRKEQGQNKDGSKMKGDVQTATTGGVKYFAIKQDKDELKRLRKEKQKSRSDYSKRETSSRINIESKSLKKTKTESSESQKNYSNPRDSSKHRSRSKKRKRRQKNKQKESNSDID